MSKPLSYILALLWLLALAAPAAATDPQALLQQAGASLQAGQKAKALALLDQAAQQLWNQTGLGLALATLTKEEAQGFGMFNSRPDNVFKSGDPVLVYLEPVGYQVTSPQEGVYKFHVGLDVVLLSPQGDILWGKENILEKQVTSRRFNREFYLTASLNFSGIKPGDYMVKFVLHDRQNAARSEVKLPITYK